MATVTIFSEPLIEQFGRGFSAEEEATPSCSGDALNIAGALTRMLGRLGEYTGKTEPHKVTVLCGLGADERGGKIKHFMSSKGENIASTRHTITLKGRKTAGYTIHKEEGGTKRSVEYIDRGPESAMCQLLETGMHRGATRQALDNISKHSDVLVVTGIGASRARSDDAFNKLIALAVNVKKRGGKIVVDLNHRFDADTGNAKLWVDDNGHPLPGSKIRERMDRLFALADLSFVAHDEIWPLYGELYNPPLYKQDAASAEPIIAYLRRLKPPEGCEAARHIMFKRGKEGGTLFYHNGNGNADTIVPIPPNNNVAIVDRTGGGDGLMGGTIAALLRGYTLDQALNVGQLTAGKVIQHPGGVLRKDFLPGNAELDSRIPSSPKTNCKWGQDRARQRIASRHSSPLAPPM